MENFKRKILNHNNKMLNIPSFKRKEKTCNCTAEPCPLNKNGLPNNLIYKVTVKTDNTTKNYIVSTSTTIKDRYRNYKARFNNEHKRYSKELSNCLWEQKYKLQSNLGNSMSNKNQTKQ